MMFLFVVESTYEMIRPLQISMQGFHAVCTDLDYEEK